MRSRGLGDVLHYFISEDEQREARSRASGLERRAPTERWCIPTSRERPLASTVALDLAVATTQAGVQTELLIPFPASDLLLDSPRILCRSVTPATVENLEKALAETAPGTRSFIVLPPESLAEILREAPEGLIEGLLLVVDGSPAGPAQMLKLLRQLPRPLSGVRIAAALVEASGRQGARELFRKLHAAARRQLGIEVENLGELRRDAASYRALLRGVSVLDADPEAESSASLRRLGERLIGIQDEQRPRGHEPGQA